HRQGNFHRSDRRPGAIRPRPGVVSSRAGPRWAGRLRREDVMRTRYGRWLALAGLVALAGMLPGSGQGGGCSFSGKDKDILQPGQKVFISWDPMEKTESWTVQPKFEGNASDFGMVIPTPSQPKLDEMPRDFFKELALYSLLKRREYPQSKLLPV